MPASENASSPAEPESIDAVIRKEVVEAGERVSKETAKKVLARRREALPLLVEIVRGKEYWESGGSWAPYTALYLLAMTKEKEALEAIIDAMYNHAEELGDWLTEDVRWLLAYFGEVHIGRLMELVLDRRLSPFARDAAARAAIMIARDTGREELSKTVGERLRKAVSIQVEEWDDADDVKIAVTLLAFDLAETKDRGSLPLIKSIYDRGLADIEYATYDDIQDLYEGRIENVLSEELAMRDPMDYFTPTAESGEGEEEEETGESRPLYKAFRCADCGNVVWDAALVRGDSRDYTGSTRLHAGRLAFPYTGIGRNGSCPCGSGRKYKKCCLPSLQAWDIIDRRLTHGYSLLEGESEEEGGGERKEEGGEKEKGGGERQTDSIKVCESWLTAWNMMRNAIGKEETKIDAVSTPFRLCELLSNWAQDFENELWNAGLADRRYHEERIRFSRWFCGQFTEEEKGLNLGNMYSAEATSMGELGDVTGAERRFEELAKRLPRYVWGWIHWSDMYWLDIPKRIGGGMKNYERAESILLRCLEQEGLDEGDRKDVEDRLKELRREMDAQAGEVRSPKKVEGEMSNSID